MAIDYQRQIDELTARLARVERRRKRRRSWPRLLPMACVAALVALMPLATFAANFRDLNPGSPHNGNINAIADAGITTGCTPGIEYCPNGLVTREEMASFLARTAGLGGNVPVVNARTLGGFRANDLARATGAGQGNNPFFVTTSYQEAIRVTITAPAPGFVHLTGALTAYAAGSNPSSGLISVIVVDPQKNLASAPQSAVVGTSAGSIFYASIGTTVVAQVPQAGTYTYLLAVGKDNLSFGSTSATNGLLTAIYVPFGPNGALAAEADASWTTPGAPPERSQP